MGGKADLAPFNPLTLASVSAILVLVALEGLLSARAPRLARRSPNRPALQVSHRHSQAKRPAHRASLASSNPPVAFPHKLCYLAVAITQEGACPNQSSIFSRERWT